MRSLIFFVSFALPFAMAQAASPYSPRFARVQQHAQSSHCALPAYPKSSRHKEETGSTTIRYAVSPAGKAYNVTVFKSSGVRDLDKAAIAAIGKCIFTPASIGGKPVQTIMMAQYQWGLE